MSQIQFLSFFLCSQKYNQNIQAIWIAKINIKREYIISPTEQSYKQIQLFINKKLQEKNIQMYMYWQTRFINNIMRSNHQVMPIFCDHSHKYFNSTVLCQSCFASYESIKILVNLHHCHLQHNTFTAKSICDHVSLDVSVSSNRFSSFGFSFFTFSIK